MWGWPSTHGITWGQPTWTWAWPRGGGHVDVRWGQVGQPTWTYMGPAHVATWGGVKWGGGLSRINVSLTISLGAAFHHPSRVDGSRLRRGWATWIATWMGDVEAREVAGARAVAARPRAQQMPIMS